MTEITAEWLESQLTKRGRKVFTSQTEGFITYADYYKKDGKLSRIQFDAKDGITLQRAEELIDRQLEDEEREPTLEGSGDTYRCSICEDKFRIERNVAGPPRTEDEWKKARERDFAKHVEQVHPKK